jgi:hypothetical protein
MTNTAVDTPTFTVTPTITCWCQAQGLCVDLPERLRKTDDNPFTVWTGSVYLVERAVETWRESRADKLRGRFEG